MRLGLLVWLVVGCGSSAERSEPGAARLGPANPEFHRLTDGCPDRGDVALCEIAFSLESLPHDCGTNCQDKLAAHAETLCRRGSHTVCAGIAGDLVKDCAADAAGCDAKVAAASSSRRAAYGRIVDACNRKDRRACDVLAPKSVVERCEQDKDYGACFEAARSFQGPGALAKPACEQGKDAFACELAGDAAVVRGDLDEARKLLEQACALRGEAKDCQANKVSPDVAKALARMEELTTSLCACKDSTCAVKLHGEVNAAGKPISDRSIHTRETTEVERRAGDCYTNIN